MIFEGTKNQFFFGLELTRAGTRIPKATVLYNLAKFYGVSVDRFFWK